MRTFELFGNIVCELPPAIQRTVEGMGGHSLVFVTRKKLTSTDVNPRESRLFIPNEAVLWGLLSEDEQMRVRAGGYDIVVVDPTGEMNQMKLTAWNSWNGRLVLNRGWIELVKDNQLKVKEKMDYIVLCSFRAGAQLCFALDVERSQDHP